MIPSRLFSITAFAAAALTLALLSSCSFLKPKDDPTRHFLLEGSSPSPLVSNSGLDVLVGPISIPGYLDRTGFVTSGAGTELVVAEYDVWAESLEEGVSRVLAGNLSKLLDSSTVVPFPKVDSPNYDFKAAAVIRRFEKRPDGKVHLEVSYGVSGPLGTELKPRTGSRQIVIDVPASPTPAPRPAASGNAKSTQPAEAYAAIASAMSRALDTLSKDLARAILAMDREQKIAEAKAEKEAETAGETQSEE